MVRKYAPPPHLGGPEPPTKIQSLRNLLPLSWSLHKKPLVAVIHLSDGIEYLYVLETEHVDQSRMDMLNNIYCIISPYCD